MTDLEQLKEIEKIIGKKLKRAIEKHAPVRFDDFENLEL